MPMSWFDLTRHPSRPGTSGRVGNPFPMASTLFGMAAIMIVLWLLAVGLPHFLGTADHPVSRIDIGASK
jgi:hypothetical protein